MVASSCSFTCFSVAKPCLASFTFEAASAAAEAPVSATPQPTSDSSKDERTVTLTIESAHAFRKSGKLRPDCPEHASKVRCFRDPVDIVNLGSWQYVRAVRQAVATN